MIKVIAFDFGGVIYTYNHPILMKDVADELNQPIKAVTKAWKVGIKRYERGEITEDEFWTIFLRKLNLNYDKKSLHKITLNHFKPIKDSLKILNNLKGKITTGLISNQTSWIEDLEQKYKFKKLFDILIISKDVSSRKPSKSIFRLFIKKTDVKPKEIIFIDDSFDYKKSVESVGIKFIHFRSPRQLKTELKNYGIKF
jgi:HAD superfamily hydrolase (TIGR01509 family)